MLDPMTVGAAVDALLDLIRDGLAREAYDRAMREHAS